MKCAILTGESPVDGAGSQPGVWQPFIGFYFDLHPLQECKEIFLSSTGTPKKEIAQKSQECFFLQLRVQRGFELQDDSLLF